MLTGIRAAALATALPDMDFGHIAAGVAGGTVELNPFTSVRTCIPGLVCVWTDGGSGAIVHLAGGSAVVKFGARLHINPGQVPGNYSGDFMVTLQYF